MSAGRLVLVGAGPGDPELLTLRAVRALREADVVLVDDLVDPRALEHVRESARVIRVGKRGGCRSTPQSTIERLIVNEARAGNVVVRLKGGDALVFGRGGEELEAATRAGIRCEVVSGVTSALAAAAAAGMSLTHRACAHGAVLVTGHAVDAVDWKALVATGMTLVVYMGVMNVRRIADALRDGGMPSTTPVAIVERASCAGERTTQTLLGQLAATVAGCAIAGPAVLIVGDAVARRVAAREPLPLARRA